MEQKRAQLFVGQHELEQMESFIENVVTAYNGKQHGRVLFVISERTGDEKSSLAVNHVLQLNEVG